MLYSQKSLVYFAINDRVRFKGVDKKIKGIVNAAQDLGYNSRLWVKSGVSIIDYFKMALAIAKADEDMLIVRCPAYGIIIVTFGIMIARVRRRNIVVEVPTPHKSTLREISSNNQSLYIRSIKMILLIISGSWVFWPANKIIQYSTEGWWFRIGNQQKTIKIGNGIDVESIPIRKNIPKWTKETLKLIGVANVSSWHGYDRIIKSIKTNKEDSKSEFDIHFTIVGNGSALKDLQRLTKELNLQKYVNFTGKLFGEELYNKYDEAHIAIGSLGLHRIGLEEAGTLKLREYCAVGIPFIYSGKDPDFTGKLNFCRSVPQSDCVSCIVKELKEMVHEYDKINPLSIRDYANKYLDFREKIKVFLCFQPTNAQEGL